MTKGARSGQLELTWANKDMRLLSHDDVSYEWVDPTDWRVAEVRLLNPVDTFGEDADQNLLIRGDALHALTALTSMPEVANTYRGQVKLAYIDPPFNTGQTFANYDDALEHSVWLTMLRDRLEQIHTLLRMDGSVWVHLDDSEAHRGRSVLDEVFGAENFVTTIYWLRKDTRANDAKFFSPNTDQIHIYAKDINRFKINRLPRDEAMNDAYRNPDDDPRGPWLAAQLYAKSGKGTYTHTFSNGVEWSPPAGTFPRFSPARLDEMDQDGRIWFGVEGTAQPTFKQYLSEAKTTVVPTNNWHYQEVGSNRHSRLEQKKLLPKGTAPFATTKPERLMERIIHIGSDEDDIVLDCFGGSGTTAAVAHKMGRRWVTVELLPETVAKYIRPRLEKVIKGDDEGGVTQALGWEGGGGFHELEIAPSMFEEHEGVVLLAEWATDGELAKAVAAQLGYAYAPEGPFAGRKGRSRLAVLDGMLTDGIADFFVAQLDDRESVTVVAQALEPGVEEHLREVRPGSRARKVPRDLARRGVIPSRLVRIGTAEESDR